ncbi:MAG: hypothetical protein ACRDT2_03025 [Natronosporangium sp.]
MAKTILYAAVSADGYVARPDGEVGPLFDWLGKGEVAWDWLLANPSLVAQGDRVTHLLYDVPQSGGEA